MLTSARLLPFAILAILASSAGAHVGAASIPTDKTKFHVFICMGQSNMAGMAPATQQDITATTRVKKMAFDGTWYDGFEPMNVNPWARLSSPASVGSDVVGPSLSFAKALADATPEITVGIVNLAMSGTNIEVWSKGSPCFLFGYPATAAEAQRASSTYNSSDANYAIAGRINQVERAAQDGTIKGILWHQGEANCGDAQYGQKLATLIKDWREALRMPSLPVVVGHVGASAGGCACNAGMDWAAKTLANVAVASSDGLTLNGAHYDNASQHTFGQRYCAQYLKLAQSVTGAAAARTPAAARDGVPSFVNGQFVVTGGAAVALRIVDASGAPVRRLMRSPGEPCMIWDGRDETGRRVPAGLYLATTQAAGAAALSFLWLGR